MITESAQMTIEITTVKRSYKGVTGHWSKWGGRRMSVIESQNGGVDDFWRCQSCGDLQPEALSPYKYEFPAGEFIRVCAPCIADHCTSLHDRVGV